MILAAIVCFLYSNDICLHKQNLKDMADVNISNIVYVILFSSAFISCSNNDSYYSYLRKSQAKPENIDTELFYKEAIKFWTPQIDTLKEFSYKQNDTLRLFLDVQDAIRSDKKHDYRRFANNIKRFIEYDSENTRPSSPILFIGSSTINFWKTADYFPERNVMNRGFGGASIKDILHYYNDVIGKYRPSSVVIYDDIDIENGESVENVLGEYISLLDKIHNDFPECRILCISIKPTPMDFLLGKNVRNNKKLFNQKLKEYIDNTPYIKYVDLTSLLYNTDGILDLRYYSEDRMHLNENGYKLWSNELNKVL